VRARVAGSGTFVFTAHEPGITEIEAGGAIFNDMTYTSWGVPTRQALFVHSVVSSRPAPNRIIVDAGFKTLPGWINQGYAEYAKRMPTECQLNLIELPAAQRSKSTDLKRAIQDEGQRILKAIPKNTDVVALDVTGHAHSTDSLAKELQQWLASGSDIALLVGGADGLSSDCLANAKSKWSLSKLTFPHPLVRVILSEQLYRAWSLMRNHPYHRA